MNAENEKTVNDIQNPENQTEVSSEEIKSEKITQEEFISEFAPEPINIPNYNKEKEMRKAEKANERNKKRHTKKSKKRRRLLRKIVVGIRNVFLFILLTAVVISTLSSLLVKLNTSRYSIESAIRSGNPETFVVGKIKSPSKINLKTSSPYASVADILRDNSLIIVTYSDIKQAVMKSSYPDFVADVTYDIISNLVYGKSYKGISSSEIGEAILKNVSYIKLVTGIELGESACNSIGKYAAKSKAIKSLSPENIAKQPATSYTHITSVLFSTMVLAGLAIALMLLIVLAAISCRGFAHKMIGWSVIISGFVTGIAGFFFKPYFSAEGEFIKSILNTITSNFNQTAVIYGAIAILIGVLVLLIGKAMSEEEEYEYEDEYIDEIEQAAANE